MIWVSDNGAFQQTCLTCQSQSFIALDTEFERTTTFYPKWALLQISDSQKNIYLVDMPNITKNAEAFSQLLSSSVVKVLHAGQEDIEIFSYQQPDIKIQNFFDTQIAAAFCGLGTQVSYQNLVKQLLDIELEKSQTRTNWLQRPLTPAQIQYAQEDVAYLLPCYDELKHRLEKQNRWYWVLEDCCHLLQPTVAISAENYYLTLSSAWYFNDRQRAALKNLCVWRENYIRQHNVPRSFMFKDGQALALAENLSTQPSVIRSLIHAHAISSGLDEVIAHVIREAYQQQEPVLAVEKSILAQKKLKPLMQALKHKIVEQAHYLNIPDVCLLKQKWLEKLVAVSLKYSAEEQLLHLPEILKGWRYAEIVQPLQLLIEKWKRGAYG